MKATVLKDTIIDSDAETFYTDRGILFISYHFPPSRAVGGMRARNFARALPRFGIRPCVLTAEGPNSSFEIDALKGLDSVSVIRTKGLPTAVDAYRRLRGFFVKKSSSLKSSSGLSQVVQSTLNNKRSGLKMLILSLFVALPDTEKNWIIPATLSALRELRSGAIDSIFTTCPPYSVHIVGLLLKTLTGVKWIADFRDPWMTTGSKRLYPTTTISLKIERWLERKVVEKADIVSFNVERLMKAYREKYYHLEPEKFVHIPNGVDPELYKDARGLKRYDRFTISYTGSMYLGRTPEPVFKALKKLVDTGFMDKNLLSLRFAGNCRFVDGRPLLEIAERYGLSDALEIRDSIPHSEAVTMAARSHLVLLLAPDQPYQIPAKVYDYMGAGAKVLAITGPGATRDFVKDTGIGGVFDPSDVEGITDFICKTYRDASCGIVRTKDTERFHIHRITKDLVRYVYGA